MDSREELPARLVRSDDELVKHWPRPRRLWRHRLEHLLRAIRQRRARSIRFRRRTVFLYQAVRLGNHGGREADKMVDRFNWHMQERKKEHEIPLVAPNGLNGDLVRWPREKPNDEISDEQEVDIIWRGVFLQLEPQVLQRIDVHDFVPLRVTCVGAPCFQHDHAVVMIEG